MGKKGYYVKQWYYYMLLNSHVPPWDRISQLIWQGESLPKFNVLCWIMVHGKLLTNKNLQKRGSQVPS
jgi:hypothetical protein